MASQKPSTAPSLSDELDVTPKSQSPALLTPPSSTKSECCTSDSTRKPTTGPEQQSSAVSLEEALSVTIESLQNSLKIAESTKSEVGAANESFIKNGGPFMQVVAKQVEDSLTKVEKQLDSCQKGMNRACKEYRDNHDDLRDLMTAGMERM